MSAPNPGTLRFKELAASAGTPPAGYAILYIKTDNVLYLKDSSGTEIALGSASAITSLSGEATGSGPGNAVVTLSNSAVIGKVLTGFTAGPNSTVLATDTILQAIQKLQAQATSVAATNLAGDVTGPFGTTVVATVGGKTAAAVAQSVTDTQAATSANTISTIVKRNASGDFAAGIITAALNGNANTATNANNFTGTLSGDVTGTQSATAISNATVTAKLLTGFVSAPGTVSAADSILLAIEKLDGNINASVGAAITGLTGDVVANGPGNVNSIIQSNVVSNAKLAQMPTLTLKGNNTGGTANALDLTVTQVTTLLNNGAIPVQIGTSNNAGSSNFLARADHVHSHGVQTDPTLHAVATTTANGFMSSSDKVKLNTISSAPGSNAQILISDGTNLNPQSVSGDISITNAGVVAVNTVTGTIPVNKGGTGATTAPAARVNLNVDQRSTFSNAAYAVLSTDRYVAQVGTMSAPRIVTLPAANSINAGQILFIADESGTVGTTNTLTVTAAGADTINGSATKTIRSAFGYIKLFSNGTNGWFTGVEAIGRGGTGLSTLPTDGQLLIGNSTNNNYVLAALSAGTGISITNAPGSITIASSGSTAFTTKTANYTILSTDSTIFVDSSGGSFTLTLPNPSGLGGKIFRVIGTGGSMNANPITLARFGSEKISGLAASKLLQTSWGWFQVTTDGTDWFVG